MQTDTFKILPGCHLITSLSSYLGKWYEVQKLEMFNLRKDHHQLESLPAKCPEKAEDFTITVQFPIQTKLDQASSPDLIEKLISTNLIW